MKKLTKILFCFLFLILAISFVNACQYTEKESYQELELGLYTSRGAYFGVPLEFTNFSGGMMNIEGCSYASFKVYNPLNEDITLNLSYSLTWGNAFGSSKREYQTVVSVSQYSYSDPITATCPDLGNGQIDPASIKYVITDPKIITLKNEMVTKSRDVCMICENQQCLDDGAVCNPLSDDEKCGSQICNIAGFCGHEDPVPCPDGLKNCNDAICLKPSTKEVREPYMCEWECKSQLTKNNLCCDISGSKVNEPYFCETECKYGIGKNNNCKPKPPSWWAYLIIIGAIILIVSIGVWYFAVYKRKEEEGKTKDAEHKRQNEEKVIDNLRKEKQSLKNSINKSKKEIIKLEKNYLNKKEEFDKGLSNLKEKEQTEIKKIHEKKKNANLEAKKALDKEIDKIRMRYNQRAEELHNEFMIDKQKIDILIEENNKKLKEANEDRSKIELEIEKTKKLMTQPFLNKQRIKVLLNQDGYEICSWDKNKSFHVWWYEKNSQERVYTNLFNVHHIDGDRRNNDYYNLIKIDKNIHDEIHYKNHKWLSYIQGVELLKKYNIPIPERVKKHLK